MKVWFGISLSANGNPHNGADETDTRSGNLANGDEILQNYVLAEPRGIAL